LDYTEADSRDTRWLQKEALILRQIERELLYDLQKAKMLEIAATTVWPKWDTEGKFYFTSVETADRIWEMLWERAMPHISIDKKDTAKSELKTWKERWEARFGKMDDPDVQRQQELLERRLKEQAMTARRERARRERVSRHQAQAIQSLVIGRHKMRDSGDLRG